MSEHGTTTSALIVAGALAFGAFTRLDAQTCTITSAMSAGPLSCVVTTAVRATIQMPVLVSVGVTPIGVWSGSSGAATISAVANTRYALQIAAAAASPSDADETSTRVTWRAGSATHVVVNTPTELSDSAESMGDHRAVLVAYSREPRRRRATTSPAAIVLTIVAP